MKTLNAPPELKYQPLPEIPALDLQLEVPEVAKLTERVPTRSDRSLLNEADAALRGAPAPRRVADVWTGGAGGGRGFVNPASASTYDAYPFAGRSTITDPAAYVQSTGSGGGSRFVEGLKLSGSVLLNAFEGYLANNRADTSGFFLPDSPVGNAPDQTASLSGFGIGLLKGGAGLGLQMPKYQPMSPGEASGMQAVDAAALAVGLAGGAELILGRGAALGNVGIDVVPGPANLMAGTDRFYLNAARRADIDPNGAFDVIAHGSTHEIEVMTSNGAVLVDQRAAARLIQNSPGYVEGQPVRLLSCSTGACDTGFAQNLANKMGIPVQAPTDLVWAYGDGSMVVAPRMSTDPTSYLFNVPNKALEGTFRTFVPGKPQ